MGVSLRSDQTFTASQLTVVAVARVLAGLPYTAERALGASLRGLSEELTDGDFAGTHLR